MLAMNHSRLGRTAALLVTLGSLCSAFNVPSIERRAALDACLSTAGVPVDTPGSADWKADVAPSNTRIPYTPVAIAVPKTEAHVQGAVSCAAQAGVKVNAKSGGHSYANFGLGGEDGHLILQLNRMSAVVLDTQTHTATVQAGARLGHVATELFRQGGRGISMGTCPGVGITGHALHGGFGFSSHRYGLALDWILQMTVVLANATTVNCSATENPDLFWAMRGAGSSFGIVTSFVFDTFAVPNQVTVFTVQLPWRDANSFSKGWNTIQSWLLSGGMAPELNMRLWVQNGVTQLQGSYHGNEAGVRNATSVLTSQLGASLSDVKTSDWMGGFVAYANGDTIDVTIPYSHQDNFYAKSLVTSSLPPTTLAAVADYWSTQAKGHQSFFFLMVDMYGGPNAYIPQSPTRDSASYAHRGDSLFMYQFYDQRMGTFPANGMDFLNGWVDKFTQNLDAGSWGSYINYADPLMSRTMAQQKYWRQSLPRLQRIKAVVDPADMFHYPQGVEPAVSL